MTDKGGATRSADIEWSGVPGRLTSNGWGINCARLREAGCWGGVYYVQSSRTASEESAISLGWRKLKPFGWVCPECVKVLEDQS